MREFKILGVLVAIIGVIYWGVEPLAHSVFHPKVAPADYKFMDLEMIVDNHKGDAQKGKIAAESNCIACHSIKSQGFRSESVV